VDKKNSGVGVLDKAVTILGTLESGPHSLAELVAATGIERPTAHRLAVALEHHRLVTRDLQGRFVLGPRSSELAAAAGEDRIAAAHDYEVNLRAELEIMRLHAKIDALLDIIERQSADAPSVS
jgi:DNA-binding IclR family transcriptional regulator